MIKKYFFVIYLFSSLFAPRSNSSLDRFSDINSSPESSPNPSQAVTNFRVVAESASGVINQASNFLREATADKTASNSISKPISTPSNSIAKSFGLALGKGAATSAGKALGKELTRTDELGGIDLDEFIKNIKDLKDLSDKAINQEDWDVITKLRDQKKRLMSQISGSAIKISRENGKVNVGYASAQSQLNPEQSLEEKRYTNTPENRISGFGSEKQPVENNPSIDNKTIDEAIKIIDIQLNKLSQKEVVLLDYLRYVQKQINQKALKNNTLQTGNDFLSELDKQIKNIQNNQTFDDSKLIVAADNLIKARVLVKEPVIADRIVKDGKTIINGLLPVAMGAVSSIRSRGSSSESSLDKGLGLKKDKEVAVDAEGLDLIHQTTNSAEDNEPKVRARYRSDDSSATDLDDESQGRPDDLLDLMDDQADSVNPDSRKGKERVEYKEERRRADSSASDDINPIYKLKGLREQIFQTEENRSGRFTTRVNRPAAGPSSDSKHR